MRSKLLSVVLLVLLLAGACAPQPAPALVRLTTAPPPVTLTVLAAASLAGPFDEMGKLFESQNPGVTVALSYGGSQALAGQLDQGAPADVFASASPKYMLAAVTSGRVNRADPHNFVLNRLVVILPRANPAAVTTLQDLAKPGLKLDLADKSVPAGQYALDFLDKTIRDPGFDPKFRDGVLENVVSYETNVKAVVSKVALGEADAGIAYVTDYQAAAGKLAKLDIPDSLNMIATYPIAPISDSKNPRLAQAFVALVLSPTGQAIMARYGFVPAIP
jgi:molybdate transport system substrate-binding protein